MVALATFPQPRASAAAKAAARARARRNHPIRVAVAVSSFGDPFIADVDAPVHLRATVREAVFAALYAVETAGGYAARVDEILLENHLPAELAGKVAVLQTEFA